MLNDDHGIQPLVIDTSTAATFDTECTDQTGSEAVSVSHTDVDPDAAQSTELSSTSRSSPVLPVVLPPADCSENFDEEDDQEEYEEMSERHHDESVSSDSQSTAGSSSKDLTGSMSTGDLSPGPGTTGRCSKSRRKADRVRTTTAIYMICCILCRTADWF